MKGNVMKTKTETMYASMPEWRLFFIVALPGMISMFAMSIYSVIEGVFIGHVLGEEAFAAINIAMPLVMINFSLADLVGVGASVPISIALGKEDYKTANNVFTSSVLMIFSASVLMGTVMFSLAPSLSRLMGADDVLLETSVRYLRTFALCSPLTTIFFALDNYLRVSGYVKTSMVINIFSNVLTVVLLSLFLLVVKMDVVGSALATCISMSLCSLIASLPFLTKKTLLKFTRPSFSRGMVKEIVTCGSPVFLSNISGRVTSILMNISLMTLGALEFGEGGGTTAVAVYAILMYSSDLCWPLLYGISDSLSTSIGYNWGAGNYDRVKKIAKCSFVGTGIVGLVSTSILFFFPQEVASLFVKEGEMHLLEISTHAIKLFCFAYLFRWICVSTQGFLSALEKPLLASSISVSIAFVFPVVIMGALWHFGLDSIWFNFTLVNFFAAILSGYLLKKVFREIDRKKQEQN